MSARGRWAADPNSRVVPGRSWLPNAFLNTRRYRGHVPFFAVFVLVALVEMATFFWVESRIGLGLALGLALLTAVIGSMLVRRAGLTVLGAIRSKWSEGKLPGRELTHGAAILVAGAFLISPGFITDTLGFLLLVPAVRDWIHRLVSRRISARVGISLGGQGASYVRQPPGESDIIDVDPIE